MTDHETPGFKVVDKRRGTSERAADDPDAGAGESAANSSGTAPAATPQVPPWEAPAVEVPQGAEPDSEAAPSPDMMPESMLPDPALLMAYTAMRMDVRELMHTLLVVFDGQAWRAMGMVADPATGEMKRDLPAAQLAIDVVGFLLGKLDSSLENGEKRELQRRLNDLRVNYVAQLREN